jgi:hypothetical protein
MELTRITEKKRTRFDLDRSDSDDISVIGDSMATAADFANTKTNSNDQFEPETVNILNKLLTTLSTNLHKGLQEEKLLAYSLRTDNATQPTNTAIQDFIIDVERAKIDLSTNLKLFSDSDLRNNVQSGMFNRFKDLRTEMTTWYRAVWHFCNTKSNKDAKPKSLIQLTVRFSPAVTDTNQMDKITEIYKNCTKKLEYDLEFSVLTRLRELHSIFMDKWTKVNTDEEKFMWAKVYKIVLRQNKENGPNTRSHTADSEEDSSFDDGPTIGHQRGHRRGRRTFVNKRSRQLSDRNVPTDDVTRRQRSRHYHSERSDSDDSTYHRQYSLHGRQRGRQERRNSDYQASSLDDDDFIPRRRRSSRRQWRNHNYTARDQDNRPAFRQIP